MWFICLTISCVDSNTRGRVHVGQRDADAEPLLKRLVQRTANTHVAWSAADQGQGYHQTWHCKNTTNAHQGRSVSRDYCVSPILSKRLKVLLMDPHLTVRDVSCHMGSHSVTFPHKWTHPSLTPASFFDLEVFCRVPYRPYTTSR